MCIYASQIDYFHYSFESFVLYIMVASLGSDYITIFTFIFEQSDITEL